MLFRSLKSLFEKAKIRCGVIISRETDDILEMKQLVMENESIILDYQLGKIDVLINVNILTEDNFSFWLIFLLVSHF